MGGVSFVWLGASRRDGVYWWLDNTRITNFSGDSNYTAWLDAAPPDFWRDGCVRMARSSAKGNWTSARCADVGAFICEIPLGSAPATPPISPPAGTKLLTAFATVMHCTVECM